MLCFSWCLRRIHACKHLEKEHSRQSGDRARVPRLEQPFESEAPKRSLSGAELTRGRVGREQVLKDSVSWDKKCGFYSKSAEIILDDLSDILCFTFQKGHSGRGVKNGSSGKGQERNQRVWVGAFWQESSWKMLGLGGGNSRGGEKRMNTGSILEEKAKSNSWWGQRRGGNQDNPRGFFFCLFEQLSGWRCHWPGLGSPMKFRVTGKGKAGLWPHYIRKVYLFPSWRCQEVVGDVKSRNLLRSAQLEI